MTRNKKTTKRITVRQLQAAVDETSAKLTRGARRRARFVAACDQTTVSQESDLLKHLKDCVEWMKLRGQANVWPTNSVYHGAVKAVAEAERQN
jgi:hypothetical protein